MLPDGWVRQRLGKYLKESRIAGTDGSIAKKITVKLYGKGVFGKDEKRQGSENTKYFKRKSGQFIYSKLDFLNGAFGIIPQNLDGYESTSDMPAFDSIAEINLAWLLYHFSRDSFYKSFAGNAAGGRKAKRIQVDEFLNIEIGFPPIHEQKRIAEVLDSVDAAIEATRAVIDQTNIVKQGLLQTLFTRGIGHTKFKNSILGEIPKTWEIRAIEDVLSRLIDYRGVPPPKAETGVPLITAKNVRKGFLNPEPREYVAHEDYDSWMRRGLPKSGDVLFTTEAPLGNVARIPDYKVALGQRTLTLCADERVMTPDFLFWALQAEILTDQINAKATGTTAQGIKQSVFRRLNIVVPPLNEQNLISQILNKVSASLEGEVDKLATLLSLKKGLMNDLLTGNVRVAMPADVPAKNVVPFTLTSPVDAVRKHAVLSAEITAQLYQLPTFGATKREKVTDLVVRHVGLDETTDRQATRHAAGSYDPKARREIDETFEREKWFSIRRDENAVRFTKGTAFGDHKAEFDEYFGSVKQPIQKVINLLRDYPTQHCEIIDTLYTAWNDFLIDGKTPTETEIIDEVLTNWHDSKQAISRQVWRDGLAWMKARDFVPSGRGRSTKTKSLL